MELVEHSGSTKGGSLGEGGHGGYREDDTEEADIAMMDDIYVTK